MACGEAACKRVVTGARLLVLYSGRRGLSWKNLSVCPSTLYIYDYDAIGGLYFEDPAHELFGFISGLEGLDEDSSWLGA